MRLHLGFEEASNKDATLTKTQSARVKRVTPHNLQRRPKPPITRTALTTEAREHTRPVAYGSAGYWDLSHSHENSEFTRKGRLREDRLRKPRAPALRDAL